jgi:hypothetical protein
MGQRVGAGRIYEPFVLLEIEEARGTLRHRQQLDHARDALDHAPVNRGLQ